MNETHMPTWFEEAIKKSLGRRKKENQFRRLVSYTPASASELKDEQGRTLVDLTTNDALALSCHPQIVKGAKEWVSRFGAGARASRLLGGTWPELLQLENQWAAWQGEEAALLFNSGYQANATVLPALFALGGGRHAEIYCDRLSHASILQGCQGGHLHRFRHNDMSHLEDLLKNRRRKNVPGFLLSETVFSMNGDLAPLDDLMRLAREFDLVLYLDEAHATGVLGQEGKGLAAGNGCLRLNTLGKAFGAGGAMLTAPRAVVDYLINFCPGFIYSTAPTPAIGGALSSALKLIPTLNAEREHLASLGTRLRHFLTQRRVDTCHCASHIVPAVLGEAAHALAVQEKLKDRGFLVLAVRPPTVPTRTSRLRFSLSSALSNAHMDGLEAALVDVM